MSESTTTEKKKSEKKLPIGIDKPICFFDLETTGLEIANARIVSISIIKLFPNGKREAKSSLVNPTIPIPPETTEIHGITNEAVQGKPTFSQLAKAIKEFIGNSYLGGFNSDHYDIPVLAEEFCRCGFDFPDIKINKAIDAGTIFKKMETRTLTSALKFYCGEELGEDAHDSYNDTLATVNVFIGQLEMYEDLAKMDINEISEFCKYDDRVDFAGKIVKDEDGDYVFNFGQHKGRKLTESEETRKYCEWILRNDFTHNTKMWVQKALGIIPDESNGELNFEAE